MVLWTRVFSLLAKCAECYFIFLGKSTQFVWVSGLGSPPQNVGMPLCQGLSEHQDECITIYAQEELQEPDFF